VAKFKQHDRMKQNGQLKTYHGVYTKPLRHCTHTHTFVHSQTFSYSYIWHTIVACIFDVVLEGIEKWVKMVPDEMWYHHFVKNGEKRTMEKATRSVQNNIDGVRISLLTIERGLKHTCFRTTFFDHRSEWIENVKSLHENDDGDVTPHMIQFAFELSLGLRDGIALLPTEMKEEEKV
jgi:hypothetical protein